jgi:2'-hydroxyisoflavone reductase
MLPLRFIGPIVTRGYGDRMRILVIGGTRFVGKHFVAAALERGHEVTVFHRGRTGADLFPEATHLRGDRNTDLGALAEGEWDATVDVCAYVPSQVRSLAAALEERGGHHLFVSSVSAYAPPPGPGITEDAPLAQLDDPSTEEVTNETYGGLKVLCERAAVDAYGPDTAIVRPSYVVGPDDLTWRFSWWVDRIGRGGRVPVPEPKDSPMQWVDARDLGHFMVRLLEDRAGGAFHAANPAPVFTWQQTIEGIAAAVAPEGTDVVWVPVEAATGLGLEEGTIPLWAAEDPEVWGLAVDPSAAFAAGLAPRPLEETVRDTLAWTREVGVPDGAGLSREQERALLDAAAR